MEIEPLRWDRILLVLAIAGIFIGSVLLTAWYIEYKVNKCTSDPLKYALEKIKKNTDAEQAYGTITLVKEGAQPYTQYFGEKPEIISSKEFKILD